ncbi:hypothetical protein CEXT_794911 [Caerostris extrusa]|uniref:Uncharacterized protein n=1 Tax=Caerostris extrusa TaxID=172846 RepID=A0AAV4Q1U1_CAEEX|nr:hypothetical protein CEXT_794911 [Caerostris extrusa]
MSENPTIGFRKLERVGRAGWLSTNALEFRLKMYKVLNKNNRRAIVIAYMGVKPIAPVKPSPANIVNRTNHNSVKGHPHCLPCERE